MEIPEIGDYLVKLGLLHDPQITLLGKGESNINYLARDAKNTYVVRLSRSDIPGSSRFMTEHHYMRLIEALGISFAPRSIHYDAAADIHVTSYIGGEDASIVDLDGAQTKLFIAQLKLLNAVTYDMYLEWCGKNGLQPYEPQKLTLRNKVNLTDRLQTIRSNADNPFAKEVLTWAEPKLSELMKAEAEARLTTTFLHDDLRWNEGGGNLKVSGDKVVFIDWELSGFFDAAPEIGDVLGSIPGTIADKTVVRRLYETYIDGEDDVDALNKKIRYGILWGKLGNPLWAAERYFLLSKEGNPEVGRYRYLAELGMEDSGPFFTLPFEQWF